MGIATDTGRSLLARAEAIADRVAATAAASDQDRKLAPEAVEAMAEASLWRILTPRAYGGLESGLRAQVDTVMVMARASSSAGWVQMVLNAHACLVGSFPGECQDEVFSAGADTRIPGTLAAQGTASRVSGGWRLDGRWQFASGVDHGDWLLVGAKADVVPDSGSPYLHVVVPKTDAIVDDTWHVLGLRGTGSKDLIARGVFVPDHRSIPTELLWTGRSPHGERHATHLYRLPLLPTLAIQMSAAAVGIAEAALGAHLAYARGRMETYTGQAKSLRVGAQIRIAEAAAELTSAGLLVRQAADISDGLVASGAFMDIEQRATLKWYASYAVELARRATERVFASAGGHAVYDDCNLQTHYRDMNTACHHAIVDFDTTGEIFGRQQLGLDLSGMA